MIDVNTRDAPVTVHRLPIQHTTGGTGGTVAPGVRRHRGYGVLPPLHSYKSGMQRDDGTPYPPYYPAMYTGATALPVSPVAGEPVTGGPVIHRHRCMPTLI